MTRQIALPLDWPRTDTPGRFIPAPANEDALFQLRHWGRWPVKAAILTGPRRSGRSLLGRQFVEEVGARLFDDAEDHDEEELFHAWNRAQEDNCPLLMVADSVPPQWQPELPDLRTRLAVCPIIEIGDPDDALLGELLELHFADRGLHLPTDSKRYLVERSARSYWDAEMLVEAIDRFALANGARLTVPTIRKVLELKGQAA